MRHALSGGLWLHRFQLNGEPMAHLVSFDREALLAAGRRLGMAREWLQQKPLKHVDSGVCRQAWHWDLRGRRLELAVRLAGEKTELTQGRSA